MLKSTFGLTTEPFNRNHDKMSLLPQQKEIFDVLKIHSQHGGFSVVIGSAGVGKTVLKSHLEELGKSQDTVVVSISRTMHSYCHVLNQLADSFKIDASAKTLEKELIQSAYTIVKDRKTLFTLIDEAHLMYMDVLRKLRLLFGQFPKNNNLILFGQRDLLYYLSMRINEDLKTRITYSKNILPLNDNDLEQYIIKELEAVKLGINTFDQGAIELIIRSVTGNLRLCRNLCYGSLIEACRDGKRIVNIKHVNNVLIQPHWRSHDELVKQQAD
jgi:MSHA biogenesis protein MshM